MKATDTDTDTDTDTMPEPGTIEEARRIVGSDLREAFLLGADGVVALARLALSEHERAEALARRVAELEQWQADVTTAVETMTGRKVKHFSTCDWCGACSPDEAGGRCEPREDETGERSCPGIEGPVAEVWDDGANAVVLMLREEMQHAAIVTDESKRLARRVAELEARALRAESAVGVLAGQIGHHGLTEAAAAAEWAGGLLNGNCAHCDDGHNLCGHNTPFGTCRHCGRNGPAIHTTTESKDRAVSELEAANADD